MGMLDVDIVQADKYQPTVAPIFADMSDSWAGRPPPERSVSCPPLPALMSTQHDLCDEQPPMSGPCGPQDWWQRTCGPQVLMRATEADMDCLSDTGTLQEMKPWESIPMSEMDRSLGVLRPRAAKTRYLMSMTRYLNSQRHKSSSSLGFTEPRTKGTKGRGRGKNRQKISQCPHLPTITN